MEVRQQVSDTVATDTRQVIRNLIVENGPITASALAQILDLTTAAVRRHIIALEADNQIVEHEVRTDAARGRGRPARHYVVTDSGRESLTEGYSDLALKALTYMKQVAGEDTVEGFAAFRTRELERRYTPVVEAAGKDPRRRAQALADALTDDGYAASVRPVGDGNFALQLCQGHCPISDAASEFPQLCDAELVAFSRILDLDVRRLATLVQGEHVCTTHIPLGGYATTPNQKRFPLLRQA